MRRILTLLTWLVLAPLALAQEDALPLYELPNPVQYTPVRSGTAAAAGTGRLVVSNMLSGTASLVDVVRGEILAEWEVGGEPQGVAVTPDNTRALVVSRSEGTVTVADLDDGAVQAVYPVGTEPFGVVVAGDMAYVSLMGEAAVVALDIDSGRRTTIPVPGAPAGLALWGDFLYVTHFHDGALSLIYLPQGQVVRTISTGAQMSLSAAVTIDPRAGRAYLPQTVANTAAAASYDSQLVAVVNVVDLATMRVLHDERIFLPAADRLVNMPFAAALDTAGRTLYIAYAGSDAAAVIDLRSRLASAHLEAGANPRDLYLSQNGLSLFVHNAVDQTISEFELRFSSLADTIPTSARAVAPEMTIGARLFHTAADPRLAANHAMSCASCHFNRGADGRQWHGQPTPPLTDVTTSPERLNAHIRAMQRGTGLMPTGEPSIDLQALLRYLHED